jgi:hypothetical protein
MKQIHEGLVLRPFAMTFFTTSNLRPLIFSLTVFGGFIYICLSVFFLMGILLLIYAHFFRHATRA